MRILCLRRWHRLVRNSVQLCHTGTKITIGDMTVFVRNPKHPEAVPTGYLPENISQSLLRNLKWMIQKNAIGQDIFLIGIPGSARRRLALQYLELTRREVEFVTLSHDTTENDLKQRREIRGGTAYYIDQSAVRAATGGRVLVLEGIEKAERNVLPVLNNLLENREMQLEDGRFLMAADRYDKLLLEHTKAELDLWKVVRVSEDFSVIALGLPVPKYKGNPLDPPLRSRFQARHVKPSSFKEQLAVLKEIGRDLPSDRLTQLLSFVHTLLSEESSSLGLPEFPIDSLPELVSVMNHFPSLSTHHAIQRVYPHRVFIGKEGQKSVDDALKLFDLLPEKKEGTRFEMESLDSLDSNEGFCQVSISERGGVVHTAFVPRGSRTLGTPLEEGEGFISTPYHCNLLAEMLQSHAVRDLCLIGPKGCGKSSLAREFARLLGYETEAVMLYKDMSCRDLLQQRVTLPNGDTSWRLSSLVVAAICGDLAILDGIHHLHHSVISSLQRLIDDRELQLYDGTRLLRHDRYDRIKSEKNLTDTDMANMGVLRIHPSFRIVALAEPPAVGGSQKDQWLSADLLGIFHFHTMRALTAEEERTLIDTLVCEKKCPPRPLQALLRFTHRLRTSNDPIIQSLASSLSTRQLLRISRYVASHPEHCIHTAVQRACLSRFLPPLAKKALETELERDGIVPNSQENVVCQMEVGEEGTVRIGTTSAPVFVGPSADQVKVPNILFYDNPQHVAILEEMLRSFSLGEHLLLVGNQGVGKNKLVDRFLQVLNRPREYLQLHRDTSVQTLTLQSSVRDGIIVYDDSPLVRAVANGHVLVVDEADKAPTHVTVILKALVESGEMLLADGRRIVLPSDVAGRRKSSQEIITMHPDFRMIVLANRPGFPFLGNDFFAALGDIFSCHVIDNPSYDSEMTMLKQYGPDVPEQMLHRLVSAFGELRALADDGLLAYPFSTREVVNIVKHLQRFPQDGVAEVVRNVFDFDAFSGESKEIISRILHKNGIPLGAEPTSVALSKSMALPKPSLTCYWHIGQKGGKKEETLLIGREQCPLKIQGLATLNVHTHPLDKTEARSLVFTEEQFYWTLPVRETGNVIGVAISKAGDVFKDRIHVLSRNPLCLYSMTPSSREVTRIDLFQMFPSEKPSFQPRATLSVLDDSLVILHEGLSNRTLLVDTESGAVSLLSTSTMKDRIVEQMSRSIRQQAELTCFYSNPVSNTFLLQSARDRLDVVEFPERLAYSLHLPVNIRGVHAINDSNHWLVNDTQNNNYLLKPVEGGFEFLRIYEKNCNGGSKSGNILKSSMTPLSDEILSKALDSKISAPNRVMISDAHYGSIAVGFPDLESNVEVYSYQKANDDPWHRVDSRIRSRLSHRIGSTSAILPSNGQIVRCLPDWSVPRELVSSCGNVNLSGFLEVVDLASATLTYVPIPASPLGSLQRWRNQDEVGVVLAEASQETLVTVDPQGCVRTWETSLASLNRSLEEWRRMIGTDATKPLQLTIEKEGAKEVKEPKHGKVDATGAPHVGGNTWAGGTGGSDTAGLGGRGGPYRLDGGHNVFQVSQADKDSVPPEIREAARQMARQAFKQRLKEIKMSEHDARLYEKFSLEVRRQVQLLKVILESLQAKGKERNWLKHQSSGELDDYKLIEGITGERSIYKRRGNKEPELGSPQEKPKRLRLLVDVSGSMYRFNGYDGRMDRQLQSLVMVMEALQGYESKFQFDVIGHSGEEVAIEFVRSGKPPKNDRERLDVLKTMHAHTQFCMSGDNTLPATDHAIRGLKKEEADEHFVVVLSDANLDRYGIPAESFGRILTSDPEVRAFAIFLGSLGDQAHRLSQKLPNGHAFVCMDTKELPQILQHILTSSIFSS